MDSDMKNSGSTVVTIFLFVIMITLLLAVLIKDKPSGENEGDSHEINSVAVDPIVDLEFIEKETSSSTSEFDKFFASKRVDIYPKTLVTPQSLISVCENPNGEGVKDQKQCNVEIAKITKVLQVTAKPTDGWLYVKAGVSRGQAPVGPIETRYDAVWLFLDDNEHAGHLVLAQAVASRNSEDGYTEVLYKLGEVKTTNLPYEINPSSVETINLLESLTVGKHYMAAFVSTLGYGEIQSLQLGLIGGAITVQN